MNECSGRIAGLTSWNRGEEFPSLGIGHFIWYPEGVRGPFDESFPEMIQSLKRQGVAIPAWLADSAACPWRSRDEFLRDQNGEKMTELRNLLAATVGEQTVFIINRLEQALPKMIEKSGPADRATIEKRFYRVLNSGAKGKFALIDYVNFKGEGVLETERYKGQGWGMLQVLENMDDSGNPVAAFAKSAEFVLRRRVQNSPPARGESRWLVGWLKRVHQY